MGSAPAGFVYSLVNNSAATSIDLVVSVPEPAALIAVSMMLLRSRQRRSRQPLHLAHALFAFIARGGASWGSGSVRFAGGDGAMMPSTREATEHECDQGADADEGGGAGDEVSRMATVI
jgi:hypothetical protein